MALDTAAFLVKVNWHRLSGLADDDVVYDFSYRWIGAGSPDNNAFSDLRIAVGSFFSVDAGAGMTQALAAYFSGEMDRTSSGQRIDIYEVPVNPGNLGSPVYSGDFGPFAGAQQDANMPSEVACVLSCNASLEGVPEEGAGETRPRGRRRGRTYLGPFNVVASVGDLTAPARPRAAMVADMLASAKAHLNDVAVADDWQPVVFSRASWLTHDVVRYSVDDAFDTIRSRGPDATARTSVAV